MPRAIFLFFSLSVSLLLSAQQAWSADGRADYDLDDDGLIEIDDWSDLDEIRNNLDGTSLYGSSEGCPAEGCIGFELTTELDFDTNGDGVLDSSDTFWNEGEGWQPIGSSYENAFTSIFHGNGYRVLNLMIARPNDNQQGLFGTLNTAIVKNLGLDGPLMAIEGRQRVGGLAGQVHESLLVAIYVRGSVTSTDANVGGLVGIGFSMEITASYTTGTVLGRYNVGGLVGHSKDSEISSSFATGSVFGDVNVGGLIGDALGGQVAASFSTVYVSAGTSAGGLIGKASRTSVTTSYWAKDASGIPASDGGTGVTLLELQCPTNADNTSCATETLYEGWSSHQDSTANTLWDFGTGVELPGLYLNGTVYRDSDGDGALDAADEFPVLFAASVDSDGDGAIDRWTPGCDIDCRTSSGLVLDQFPESAAAIFDADWDGLPDQWNDGCDSTCQSTSGLTLDSFPNDTDNDGITNDIDDDDNNDGIVDADANSNGLIDVASWDELDAIRYSLDGVGQKLTAESGLDKSGCPQIIVDGLLNDRCQGYELVADLDFDTNGDGLLDGNDTYWNAGEGWLPIGINSSNAFSGVFRGNGHVIRNLMIARPDTDYQGLFGYLNNATIKEMGLSGPLTAIEGRYSVGGIAGHALYSQITATYVSGSVNSTESSVGGLVGSANGTQITASYVTGSVSGTKYVGGLLGNSDSRNEVVANVSTAYVSGDSFVGGLVGIWGSTSASYWATDASGADRSRGGGSGVTLAELRCPTSADNNDCASTTLYTGWSSYTDSEGSAYWDFGSDSEFPGLRLKGRVFRDGDGDGAHEVDDVFPTLFAASRDSDGDGAIDHWTSGCDTDCRTSSGLVLDQFPESAAAIVDADWDGLPDRWNDDCDSTCQSASGLTLDSFPNDTDNDGITNDIDDDDNNDGIVDADANSNGLIDVASWVELDAIRHSLDGVGQKLTAESALDKTGCPQIIVDGLLQERCQGYELIADLDFDTNGDGVLDSNDTYWNSGEGWQPIGDWDYPFKSLFQGNGHRIQNLMIARPNQDDQGLFGVLENATVNELGLSGSLMAIEGGGVVGGLAGFAQYSQIFATYANGSVTGTGDLVGGLVGGSFYTEITGSYTTSSVAGDQRVGGLIGDSDYTRITASYTTGSAFGNGKVGGLVGVSTNSHVAGSLSTAFVTARDHAGGLIGDAYQTPVTTSYWAKDVSGITTSDGGTGVTLVELQCPTTADDTGCATETLYEGWSGYRDTDVNSLWDFGTVKELPGLYLNGAVYRDGDGDGALDTDDEFPNLFAASVDSDGDGAIDRWTAGCDAECRTASGLVLDQFPDSTAAIVDADWDGLPDQWTEGCDSTCQSDSGLTLDSFPSDTDNDGIENHIDDDDNNDGIVDADSNSNGLIDVANWAELDAIRYSLDGIGQKLTAEGELDTSGCPKILVNGLFEEHCQGYELIADLDFDTNGDGALDSNDTHWNEGQGWQPIGSSSSNAFSGLLQGNGHVIRNLMIARPTSDYQGLFGYAIKANIKELGLTGPLMSIHGDDFVGGFAGYGSYSQFKAVYIAGSVAGTDDYIGGVVGYSYYSEIRNSYVTGSLAGDDDVGGLVGRAIYSQLGGILSTAQVSARSSRGGLIGSGIKNQINNSYWATDTSGINYSSQGGTSATLAELQCPTSADSSTCSEVTLYSEWSNAISDNGNSYWDFGSNTELPALVLNGAVYRDGDGDGALGDDDAFPQQFAASVDSDGDGAPDFWKAGCEVDCRTASGLVLDRFPDSGAAIIDTDLDGMPDIWNDDCDRACQSASGLTLDDDNDNDGVANTQDAFPLDAAAAEDADNDGMPDAWLAACDSVCQSASSLTLDMSLNDTDNDGVTNDIDELPANPAASVDTDGDGQPDSWNDNCDSACQSTSGLILDDDNDNDGVANADDAYPTDPARAEDEDAPEILKAPAAISVAATGESTLVTLNVNEVQAIDNFDNELDYQVELNGELLAINDDQQVSVPSGALSLDWFAVDDAGNRSEPLSQTVNVYPQVRFTLDESTTGEDREASVAVELSGPSPAYPVSILVHWVEADSTATAADVVTEGENGVNLSELLVTIDSADALENAAVRIPVVGDGLQEADEVLSIALVSAIAGSADAFAMPIDDSRSNHRMTVTDNNVAPTVQVTGSQAGENGTVFINDAGEITLTAVVEDVNGGDSHSYQWYTEELPVTPGDQASFSFDPVSMALGEYSARVVVTDDGNPMLSSEEEIFTFTLQEAAAPDDGGADDGGSDSGDQGDGDTDNGGDDDSSDGISTGGQTPVNNGGSSGGGSSGGSVAFWLLSLLALGGLWRRRAAY
ncbi:GLUG motif-containing protein [Microbulbifer sp. ARAS458-1]|uniref:GLUG motif-containing protein n=1 Tax=Microbulbifer sp. ARAS458-1 TaxID=3140242 RepID=UPI003877D01A